MTTTRLDHGCIHSHHRGWRPCVWLLEFEDVTLSCSAEAVPGSDRCEAHPRPAAEADEGRAS